MDTDSDSDFYGDEVAVSVYERRLNSFDVDEWWENNSKAQTPLVLQSRKLLRKQPDIRHFHNPYAGIRGAWQLTESVDDFLIRLPPATTDEISAGPWLFICNPGIERKSKRNAQNQNIKGCEDEAPEEDGTDLPQFCQGGMERLNLVTDYHDYINTMMPEMRTKEKNRAALEASNDILALAHATNVRAGKWMLFCPVHKVDEIWGIVAKATANNQLGIAAKVATRSDDSTRPERLMCVYTADFADKDDVERVALRLRQLGLVAPRGKPLYYKPDAFTYLGLSSGNVWDIKASIYNTRDMLGKIWK